MQRLPWLVFDGLASTDLDKIFLNSNVHIKDDGSGGPKYITVIDLSNLGGTIATIADLLAAPSQWLEINPIEVGGREFDTTKVYAIGDIVSNAGEAYRCKISGTGTWTAAEWDALEIPERAGLLYNDGLTYEIGDLVTYTAGVAGTEKTYQCKTQITTPESWQAGKWITQAEKGGLIFSVTTDYKVGDIVTKDNTPTSKVYRCVTDTTAGAMVPVEWSQLSERGGIEYDTTTYYNKAT